MKVLMTGSTGFVGKQLARMLHANGHKICHLVRRKTGLQNEIFWDFVSDLPKELPAYDVIVHLAAHVDFGQQLQLVQYNVNTVSTIKLAAHAQSCNRYFVLASMIGVNGSNKTLIDEDTPINPESHYALSKYLAEEIVKAYVENYSILRICGIYGLDGPQHLGLNQAITNAIYRKAAPVLKGSGKSRRNYICVYDVAKWILHLIERDEIRSSYTESITQEILYLAGPEIMSIREYLTCIVDTILPGMKLEKVDGPDTPDLIVKSPIFPFAQVTFKDYLRTLIS
ncbi:MAG: SDR family oxidoreductase [Planctomycetes bacterium]|nr:SDR family oxidoreductase [Planctomycetota bacterium]